MTEMFEHLAMGFGVALSRRTLLSALVGWTLGS